MPMNTKLSSESNRHIDEVKTISCATMRYTSHANLGGTKLPRDFSLKVQIVSDILVAGNHRTRCPSLFHISLLWNFPGKNGWGTVKRSVIGLVWQFVTTWSKQKLLVIANSWSKDVYKYLLQFERLTFKQGVLHQLFISNDPEHHKLVLPMVYKNDVLKMIHDGYGHQVIECTMALSRQHV